MTPDQIKALRELDAKATPGPWKEPYHQKWDDGPDRISIDARDTDVASCLLQDGREHDETWANAALVVAARNALPELLDEVERLRAALSRIERLSIESLDGPIFDGGQMTPEERAKDALIMGNGIVEVKRVVDAIRAAVEEEREACLLIAENIELRDFIVIAIRARAEREGTR